MADPGVTPAGTRLTTPSQCLPQALSLWGSCEKGRVIILDGTLPTHLELSPPSCHCLCCLSLKWVQQLSFRWWCAESTKRRYSPTSLNACFCVATVDWYRNRCLLHTSLVCLGTFLHLSEDECFDLARREYSSPSAVKDASLLGSLTISSLHVQCIVLPCRAASSEPTVFGTRCNADLLFVLPHLPSMRHCLHVEQLTCNVTSSMSFGSMMVSSVSPSPASSTSGCSSLSVPACKWQCFANFSTENAWDCSLRFLFFALLKTTSVRIYWLVDVGLVDCEENVPTHRSLPSWQLYLLMA